ncbi:heparinase II/III family protein [Paenibacillus sp. J2TS4]|uniref:FIMAH domain-containing protein n=1 Tax=Paenibacillus sp. J2TS4 TaxID=2807194 RepID=UPI001B0E1287|nr:heparinase II/III family protein [Paenibacillus sp. J2TS4]GIP33313.1 hypothetical protein J2TS4_25230 [Paenibacillus sp. J2TS4]
MNSRWQRMMRNIGIISMLLGLGMIWFPAAGWADGAEAANSVLEKALLNPGFEQVVAGKPEGWRAYEAASVFESVYDPVHSGGYSVKLIDSSAGSGNGLRSNSIVVLPGKTYRASVFGWNESGTSELYLEFWNEAGTRIGVSRAGVPGVQTWEQVSLVAEAPSNSAYATLLLYQHQNNVGTAYFDDAAFVPYEAQYPVNGDFEEAVDGKPANWKPLDNASAYSVVTEPVYSGQYSVKLEDPSDTVGPGLRSEPIPVTPDNRYKASVQSYNESGVSQLYLEFWDSSNQRIDVKIASNNELGRWKPIMIEAYAPEGAVYATLLLYQHKTNVGVAYFDRAQFETVPPEPIREFPLLTEGHPRLYFTGDELPALRDRAADDVNAPFGTSGKQLWESVEKNAQQYLTETEFSISYYGGKIVTFPLPPVQPDPMENPPGFPSPYPYWTMMTRAIQDRLETLSLAYAVTDDSVYADKAKAYMLSVTDWETWSDPTYPCGGYTCLDTAHLTFGVSMAFDILYAQLTEQERNQVVEALENKGLKPLYKDVLGQIDHNIQTLRAAALGSGAAVLLGHSPNADAYLTRAMTYYQWYLNERMESGQQEGMLYTSYATDNMIKAFDHIDRVTGVRELADHPFLNDYLVRWVTYFLAPGGGGLANFSDSGTANYFGLTMNVINAWLGNGQAGWYLKETRSAAGGLEGFLYFRPDAVIVPPDNWPESAVFDEIGWAALRSGWENNDILFAMNANQSKLGHNHFDQNSFQIAMNRSWIAGDPGYQDYVAGPVNDFTVRMGHSTIQVDGQGQSSLGGGVMTRGMLAPTYDYIKGSAPGAYTNPSLTQYDRHVVYMKPGYFVMLDDLRADEPHVYDWILYSGGLETFEIDGEAVEAGSTHLASELYLRNGGAELAAKFLGPAELPMTVTTYPGAESYGYYSKVGSGDAKKEHRFLTVMKARPYHKTGQFDESNLLPLTDSSGREVKLVQAAGSTVIFYRGLEAGDYMTVTVEVPEDGIYTVLSHFLHSPLYGKVQAYIDGQAIGGVYDGYAAEVTPSQSFIHGDLHLTAGEHTIRYEVVGKNESSGNYFIGLDAIQLLPEGWEDPDSDKLMVDAEWIQGSGAIGAKVNREDGSGIQDRVLFGIDSGEYTVDGVTSDAEQVVVSLVEDEEVAGFKMTRGTLLQHEAQTLLEGEAPFSASVDVEWTTLDVTGVVELAQTQSLRIYAPEAAFVSVNGILLQKEQYTKDEASGMIEVRLEEGRHELLIEAPAARITSYIDAFEQSGELQGPMLEPLRNSIRQTEHHRSKGNIDQARHHLQRFIDRLHQASMQAFISEAAKVKLNGEATRFMERLN